MFPARRKKGVSHQEPDTSSDDVEILPSDTELPPPPRATRRQHRGPQSTPSGSLAEVTKLTSSLFPEIDKLELPEASTLVAVQSLQASYNVHLEKVLECDAQLKAWKAARERAAAHVDDLTFRISLLLPTLRQFHADVTGPFESAPAMVGSSSASDLVPMKVEKVDKGKGVDRQERPSPAYVVPQKRTHTDAASSSRKKDSANTAKRTKTASSSVSPAQPLRAYGPGPASSKKAVKKKK